MVTPFNESRKAFDKLLSDLIEIISSEYQEVASEGTRTLNTLVSKTFDRLMEASLDLIGQSFDNIDNITSKKRFTYFYNLIDCCDENIAKYRKRVEEILSKMIIHKNQQVKELSSAVFKTFNKVLGDENFVLDFIKNNF